MEILEKIKYHKTLANLEPILTERDADGVPIITFFHWHFNEMLRERYQLEYIRPETIYESM
jgi:hypothetical protein